MLTRRRAEAGVSAIELVCVLAMLALCATLAAPGMATILANRKAQAAAHSILDGLTRARAHPIAHRFCPARRNL